MTLYEGQLRRFIQVHNITPERHTHQELTRSNRSEDNDWLVGLNADSVFTPGPLVGTVCLVIYCAPPNLRRMNTGGTIMLEDGTLWCVLLDQLESLSESVEED